MVLSLQGPENNQQHQQVRRQAAEALRYVVPQLTPEQTNVVVQVTINQLQRQQLWTITEELLKLLNKCFIMEPCSVDPALYAPVAEAMLTFSGADHLRSQAERVAVHLARTAPSDIRARVVAYLRNHPNQLYSLTWLVSLKEPISEEQLEATIDRILRAINPQPKVVTKGGMQTTSIGIGAIRPRMVKNFVNVLPSSLYDRVIDGLLEAIINEHNDLGNRSDAIWTLSELPSEMLTKRADEIADYLLWGAKGALPRSSLVNMQLASQTDPFSAFCINMGNVEQVRQSSLHTLGRLYPHVDHDHRECINTSLIAASRDASLLVRQGAAMALKSIEGDVTLPKRLLLALVVLLHDSEPEPCSWACAASGHLVACELAAPFAQDLLERLLNLAETSPVVNVRTGAAVGLRALLQSDWPDAAARQRVLATLAVLSNDVSFRVRREATVEG